MAETRIDAALRDMAGHLARLARPHALVGGWAVSLRVEARFTRDVDFAIAAKNDADVEQLVQELRLAGYAPVAVVEHLDTKRLATVRLASPSGVVVDLIAATSGIEAEAVSRASPIVVGDLGAIPVARVEELLAMKILSMSDRRPQDRGDAANIVTMCGELDLDAVRANLATMTARGFHRNQNLLAKLDALLASVREGESGP